MQPDILLYKKVVRPVLFSQDAERVHTFFIRAGRIWGRPPLRNILGSFMNYENPALETQVAGMKFKNPLGLAAGFDKDGYLTGVLPHVGFGFEEVGSVTGDPWYGNPKPRLFRLPLDKSIVVHYGLSSHGSRIVSKRLKGRRFSFPVGISIAGVCRDLSIQGGIDDYVKAFSTMHSIGDYTTINISCPNLSEGMTFCQSDNLNSLLKEIKRLEISRPVFLKIKPDFLEKELDDTLSVIKKYPFVKGLVVSNLTKKREDLKTPEAIYRKYKGGISGLPTRDKSTALISRVYKKTRGRLVIIGCGGIFTPEDAYEKILNGASLLQLITGMIYSGPRTIRYINKGLVRLLKKDGYNKVEQAVGASSG
jgi:dihydroorotate dehydrogenase